MVILCTLYSVHVLIIVMLICVRLGKMATISSWHLPWARPFLQAYSTSLCGAAKTTRYISSSCSLWTIMYMQWSTCESYFSLVPGLNWCISYSSDLFSLFFLWTLFFDGRLILVLVHMWDLTKCWMYMQLLCVCCSNRCGLWHMASMIMVHDVINFSTGTSKSWAD